MINLIIYVVLLFIEMSLAIVGFVIMAFHPVGTQSWVGIIIFVTGLTLTAVNVYRIVTYNKRLQIEAAEKLSAQEILAEWDSYGVKAKLTLSELFTGEHQHCFDVWYEKLDKIEWPIGEAFVTFKIRSTLVGSIREVHLEIPPARAEEIKAAVTRVRDTYQV